MSRDYYSILEIHREVLDSDIAKAYNIFKMV